MVPNTVRNKARRSAVTSTVQQRAGAQVFQHIPFMVNGKVWSGEKLLSNLRFTDDNVWVAQSKQAVKSMLTTRSAAWQD